MEPPQTEERIRGDSQDKKENERGRHENRGATFGEKIFPRFFVMLLAISSLLIRI